MKFHHLSLSPSLHFSIRPSPSSSFAPSCLLLSLQPPIRLFQSLSFRLSGFIRKPIPTPSRGAPSLHGPEPGNICPRDICVLIESPISSLIERTIGRSLSLSLSDSGRPAARLLLSLLFHLIRAYHPIVLSGPEIGIPGIRLPRRQSYERFSRLDTLLVATCSILTFLSSFFETNPTIHGIFLNIVGSREYINVREMNILSFLRPRRRGIKLNAERNFPSKPHRCPSLKLIAVEQASTSAFFRGYCTLMG